MVFNVDSSCTLCVLIRLYYIYEQSCECSRDATTKRQRTIGSTLGLSSRSLLFLFYPHEEISSPLLWTFALNMYRPWRVESVCHLLLSKCQILTF